MWYHPTGCEVNGPHFHSITHNTTAKDDDSFFDVKPQATYSFRKVKGLMKKAGGYVRIELVADIISMMAYLTSGDRVFFGGNKTYMLKQYYQQVWGPVVKGNVTLEALQTANRVAAVLDNVPEECEDEEEDDLEAMCGFKRKAPVDDDEEMFGEAKKQCTGDLDFDDEEITGPAATFNVKPCKQVGTKAGKKSPLNAMIDFLLQFMLATGVITRKGIMQDYLKGNEGLKGIVYHMMFGKIFDKALDLYKLSVDDTDVWRWYPHSPTVGAEPWYETVTLLQEWCNEQKFCFMRFIFHVYVLMNKMDAKVNCMALTGGSNAGKSFWMTSLYPQDIDKVGIVSKSDTFMWQDCVDKPLIVMEEAFLSPTIVETFKIIAGGQETKVDIKGLGPKVLVRTPVLVASNNNLWRVAPGQETPIRNRCFMYSNLREAKCLKGLEKFDVDKYMWYVILQYCNKFKDIAVDIAAGECEVPDVEQFDDWISEIRAEAEEGGTDTVD